jgi:polyisoprenyl-phosphate glycosyltransferase
VEDSGDTMTEGVRRSTILMPNFNDWENIGTLLPHIDQVMKEQNIQVHVVIVDDASTDSTGRETIDALTLSSIHEISVIELTRNVGPQAALAIGLGYIADNKSKFPQGPLVVMDSDHEDKPEYIPALIEMTDTGKIVFANRTQRSEGIVFRAFYFVYKALFSLLTGQSLSFGNFSAIPDQLIPRLATVSELWDSYPSAIIRARVPHTNIETVRGVRAVGKSRMNLARLVNHGIASLSVHADIAGARLLIAMAGLCIFTAAGAIATFLFRLFTDILIVGQASTILSILLVIFLQTIIIMTLIGFVVVASRGRLTNAPIREYHHFVMEFKRVFPRSPADQ